MDGAQSRLGIKSKNVSRRGVLLGGLGLALTACTSSPKARTTHAIDRPDTPWPGQVHTPGQVTGSVSVPSQTPRPVVARRAPIMPSNISAVQVIDRQQWTRTQAITSHINAMRGINRMTVHHEGWIPVHFDDQQSTAERLQKIHTVHVRDRGWADIGYHYIIDRAGRVWEGRDIRYQGAHVRNNNPHNIGIMVLGNFEKQQPSTAQVGALVATLKGMMQLYNIPVHRVKTHQELNPTACPGRSLQARMNAIRSGRTLA